MYSPHSHKHFIFLAVIAFILFSVTFSFAEKVSYTYDDLNRLTDVQYTAWKIHYDYDEAGNRTKKVITTGAAQSPEAVQGINLKPSGKKPLSSSSTASNTGTVTGSKTYIHHRHKEPNHRRQQFFRRSRQPPQRRLQQRRPGRHPLAEQCNRRKQNMAHERYFSRAGSHP